MVNHFQVLFVGTLMFIAIIDYRERRIPNELLLVLLAAAAFVLIDSRTAPELTSVVVIAAGTFLLMLIPYRQKQFGGGDIKLFPVAMLGCLSLDEIVQYALATAIAWGILCAGYFAVSKAQSRSDMNVPFAVAVFLGYAFVYSERLDIVP